MRSIKPLYILLLIFSLISCNGEKKLVKNWLTFENTINLERIQEPIQINQQTIMHILGEISTDSVPVILAKNGDILPFQLDDIDNDGNWDEFITAIDFKAGESLKLELKKVAKTTLPSFENHTNIRFGVGKDKNHVSEVIEYKRTGDPREKDSLFFQMEGPAWENDKVGFRFYFDPRNGIDIFGKTTSNMVLDGVGLKGNYHEIEDWGMDVLKVGKSLGAGAIAVKTSDGNLHRVTGETSTVFNIIKEGPVKSVFEMKYKDSKINNQTLDITHRISIYKGQWGYKSEVFFSETKDPINLVTGIVNLKPNEQSSETMHDNYVLKSFGKQSENKDAMGMAVVIDKKQYLTNNIVSKEGDDIVSSYLLEMKTTNGKPSVFYFLAGWEKSNSQFKTAVGFDQMLNEITQKIKNPIVIK